MKKSIIAALALTLAGAAQLNAQLPEPAPKTWVTVGGLMYTTVTGVIDPGSNSRWNFDDSGFGGAVGIQREFGQGMLLGVEGTLARVKAQRSGVVTDEAFPQTDASIGTGMVTGRFAYGGGGAVGIYLTGGVGTIAYKLDDLGEWNADFALRFGTGIEYQFRSNVAAALEWGRIWGYHEKEDLDAGKQNHSALRLALRYGL